MPSRAFSGSELVDTHNGLVAVKKEKESEDDLQKKIQDRLKQSCLLIHSIHIMSKNPHPSVELEGLRTGNCCSQSSAKGLFFN